MYRGRLWINRLARAAVLSPRVGSFFVHVARFDPGILRLLHEDLLTRKIVFAGVVSPALWDRFGVDGPRGSGRLRHCRAALTVLDISIAIVIGPTPPGTGVIALAFCDFVKCDVANESITALVRRVLHAINSDIDNDSAIAHVIGF